MSSNQAAWITSPKARPLAVKEAPYPTPAAGEVVTKNAYVAINPVDWYLQDLALFNLDYPHIFGHDLAGEIVEVGDEVQGLQVGQRVIG